MMRKWRGLSRKGTEVALELQYLLLRLCDKYADADGKEIDFEMIKSTPDFFLLNMIAVELQQVIFLSFFLSFSILLWD